MAPWGAGEIAEEDGWRRKGQQTDVEGSNPSPWPLSCHSTSYLGTLSKGHFSAPCVQSDFKILNLPILCL